ncbi:glycosyltransferase family 87 protein [Pedobacter sp. SYSU D00535]|uniref:glycosyltransferase family 87 protein n=1 Tax=Pedobacter sp. SYSU D00535 TaxID=2810308 RepID=UPI001A96B4C0|nr:glycosyltransferase family 87 protein [Pedobacter sp. SYSU D00535]
MQKFLQKIGYTRLLLVLWIILPVVSAVKQVSTNSHNNYLIFKHVFINTLNNHPLYQRQPEYFLDNNHYGPFFGLFFAPFALLPDMAGAVLWALFNSLMLFWAIWKLPLTVKQRNLILLISTHELITSLLNLQINPFTTALVIFTYIFAIKHKEILAGLMIAIGFLIKLYGIVGFAFILFARRYVVFVVSFAAFTVLLALLPLFISSWTFQLEGYHDWAAALSRKNGLNLTSTMQNVSVMGLIQRNIYPDAPTAYILGVGLILMSAMVLLNFKQLSNDRYRMLLLAAVLLFAVLFSTGSESATYIIAFVGVAIWYVTKPQKNAWDHFLLIFALVLTSLSPTDLFPAEARTFIREHRLKALPCLLVWLEVLRESYFLKRPATVNE